MASRAFLDAHTHFFTYGENVGGPGWIVPLCGVNWRPTRPPVLLEEWPLDLRPPGPWTTILTWENKGKNIVFEGNSYVWSKHTNFLRFVDVPKRTGDKFCLAMLPPEADVERQISKAGWMFTDSRPVSASLDAYAEFIRSSCGEFTVAKDIYVRPNSGWFSDRSVCYLASGRPVITMETGFSRFYPVGEGLFAFSTIPDVEAAVAEVRTNYAAHSRRARELAGAYFGSASVLSRLLGQVGM
jgi:hypothetical protein